MQGRYDQIVSWWLDQQQSSVDETQIADTPVQALVRVQIRNRLLESQSNYK